MNIKNEARMERQRQKIYTLVVVKSENEQKKKHIQQPQPHSFPPHSGSTAGASFTKLKANANVMCEKRRRRNVDKS